MGGVKIPTKEEGAIKVMAQHYNLELLRPEGLERHRVAGWPNGGCSSRHITDTTFNRVLKFLFLVTISVSLISTIVVSQFLARYYGYSTQVFQLWGYGLAVFVIVVCIGISVITRGSTPPRKEEVPTISGFIHQV